MYSYNMLLKDIENLENIKTINIGISYGGRPIPCLHIGNKKGLQIIICAAIHAREHITSKLAIELVKFYKDKKEKLCGGGMYVIPMANPDGVCLCIEGLKSVGSVWDRKNLLKLNNGKEDFSLWKANLNGVDLNVNFDANFGSGISNINYPSAENFTGDRPFSEPETKALRNFTEKIKPACVLCYHCKGEVIYWKFYQQNNLIRDRILADILAKTTGYTLVDEMGSAGGYKDWCIQKLNIPSFTIEVGQDCYSHPFPYSKFKDIFKKNKNVPYELLKNLTDIM